jgi:hypothetical protein
MKSNVGYSTLESAFEAGKETAEKAKHGLKGSKVGMLFTSVDYNQNEVMKGVKSVVGDTPIVGCTSSGAIIVPDGVITSDHGFAGMLLLDDENMVIGAAGSPLKNGDARETGRMVAMEALDRAGLDYAPSYYYMVASPKEEEYYVKGIQDVIGDVPFFGGSAADNALSGDWSIFCDGTSFSDGVAVIFFYTDKPIETVYTGAYHESKNVGIITKIDGDRKLVEIDGVPALKKYAEWTNKNPDELMGMDLLVASITAPLGVKDTIGDLIAIRHPMGGNKDYSINIGNKLAVNTAIIQMECTVDELISSTGATLKDVNNKLDTPAAYFLVHCGGRKMGIGDRIEEVHKELVKASKGVPFITIFTFGEYGYNEHTRNTCGGLMLSFTGFEK